ncbi:MAG: M48 family metallopeptidase, partial [Rhizobiales bacterium]|nr:M48 family metallopeptidase [Hyphomicrobiales bacterium]
MKIDGRYFEANASTSCAVTLEGSSKDKLRVEVRGDFFDVEYISVSDRLAGVPRKIRFSDGSIFETDFDNAVDQLLEMEKGFGSSMSRLEASWKVVAVLAVTCIGLVYGIFTYGLPAAAAGAAAVTPSIALTAIDNGALGSLDATIFEKSKLPQIDKDRLQKMFVEIIAASGQISPKPKLLFRDSPVIGPNAFALPGGTVIFTDQIIELAENDDELAGVVAHEIGHVTYKHGLKQIYRVLGVGFMIGVIGGDSSQLIDEVVTQAALIQNFSYTRGFE